jgi:hypothetical protein
MCNKKTFKGSINGCQYTDKNEFIKALKNTDLGESVSIQCNETEENNETADYFADPDKFRKDFKKLRSLFTGDFGKSFLETFIDMYDDMYGQLKDTDKEIPANTAKTEDKPSENEDTACQGCQGKLVKEPDEDDFIRKYITEPCDIFTEPLNTNELKQFSENHIIDSLNRLYQDFEKEAGILFPKLTDQSKIIEAYTEVSRIMGNTLPTIQIAITDIKASIEKLDTITAYYNDLDMRIPHDISDKREKLNKDLDELYAYVNNLKHLSKYYSRVEKKLSL